MTKYTLWTPPPQAERAVLPRTIEFTPEMHAELQASIRATEADLKERLKPFVGNSYFHR